MAGHRTKSPRLLRTVRAVVHALGGTNATAARFDVVPSAVANWLSRNCIPPAWFLRVEAELKPLGCKADPTLFKQRTRSEPSAA